MSNQERAFHKVAQQPWRNRAKLFQQNTGKQASHPRAASAVACGQIGPRVDHAGGRGPPAVGSGLRQRAAGKGLSRSWPPCPGGRFQDAQRPSDVGQKPRQNSLFRPGGWAQPRSREAERFPTCVQPPRQSTDPSAVCFRSSDRSWNSKGQVNHQDLLKATL